MAYEVQKRVECDVKNTETGELVSSPHYSHEDAQAEASLRTEQDAEFAAQIAAAAQTEEVTPEVETPETV